MHLNRKLPIEGGLYEWARLAFGDQVGFMVAWNLWLYAIIYVGIGGLLTVSFLPYVSPAVAWITASKGATIADIDGAANVIVLKEHKTARKTGKPRRIPIGRKLGEQWTRLRWRDTATVPGSERVGDAHPAELAHDGDPGACPIVYGSGVKPLADGADYLR